MHIAVFLPVPLHQLFPSGGRNYLHNLKGPRFLVALFFCPKFPDAEKQRLPRIAFAQRERGKRSPAPFQFYFDIGQARTLDASSVLEAVESSNASKLEMSVPLPAMPAGGAIGR